MQQAQIYLINKATFEVIGPVHYSYVPGTSYIIDYNKLAHEQFPELDAAAILIECKELLNSTIYAKGSEKFSAIRTKFFGNANHERGFITKWDKREEDGEMNFETFVSATYADAIQQHIALLQHYQPQI